MKVNEHYGALTAPLSFKYGNAILQIKHQSLRDPKITEWFFEQIEFGSKYYLGKDGIMSNSKNKPVIFRSSPESEILFTQPRYSLQRL